MPIGIGKIKETKMKSNTVNPKTNNMFTIH